MHKYMFFLRYVLLTGFTLYTCIKRNIKVVFFRKEKLIFISVKLRNFKVKVQLLHLYGKNKYLQ